MANDDRSCQPASTLPLSDKPSPQQWGLAQAEQAPPWSDRTWREATACLGLNRIEQD